MVANGACRVARGGSGQVSSACDVLSQGASDLAAEASVTFPGQLRDGFGELGFDSRADVYQMLVD
jgi:hypothetical protein